MAFSHPEYTVIRELGRGASGVVYLAVQNQLNRRVALKVISDPLALHTTRQRFLREARILAQLHHPNILPVYDLTELPGQQGFLLVMAYINGGTLRDRSADITLQQTVLMIRQIARALDYAHRSGFVHRDVKPDNILYQGDVAMLADFGIARPTESQTQMTQHGAILGTPTYMSPEQVNGGSVDARSDLYSLGIVFYELLAGHPPFQTDSAIATGIQHLTKEVPALPTAFASCQPFVNKALAKEKSDRPRNASEFFNELKQATDQLRYPGHEPLYVLRGKRNPDVAGQPGHTPSPPQGKKRLIVTSSALLALGVVAAAAAMRFLPALQDAVRDTPGRATTAAVNLPADTIANPSTSVFADTIPENVLAPQDAQTPNPGQAAQPEPATTTGVETVAPVGNTTLESSEPIIDPDPDPDPVAGLLAQADQLRLDRVWLEGEINAVSVYQQVLARDPGRADAKAALQEIFDSSHREVEQQIRNGKLGNATSLLQGLNRYWPQDSRLSMLGSELESAREEKNQAAARQAAQQQAAEQARQQRIRSLLARAVAAEKVNQLVEPAKDNALYFYQSVLAEDSGNAQAKNAIDTIRKRVLQNIAASTGLVEITANETKLDALERLYPDDPSISIVRNVLQTNRQQAEQLQAEQARRAAQAQELDALIALLQSDVRLWMQEPVETALDSYQDIAGRIALLQQRSPDNPALLEIETSASRHAAELQTTRQPEAGKSATDAFRIPGF